MLDGKFEHRHMLQCERDFLLVYASQDFFAVGRNKEAVDEFAKNLIQILNHFFEYGFVPKHLGGNSDTMSNSSNYRSEDSSSTRNHYWDLITKYFAKEYQSISYINDEYCKQKDGEEEVSKEERSLTWLIITLNEDQLLYYLFHSTFRTGTFLSYYDESKSFLFQDRQKILEIARKVYDNKLFINSTINQKYQAYIQAKLEERRRINQ